MKDPPVIAQLRNREEVTVLGRFPATSGAVDESDSYQVTTSAGTGYINSQELTSSELMEEGEEMATIAQIGPQAPAKEQLDTKEAGQQLVALDPSGKGIEAYSRPTTDFAKRSFIKNAEQVTLIGTVDAAAHAAKIISPKRLT